MTTTAQSVNCSPEDFVVREGFACSTCGQWHDELPMSFGADTPYWYDIIAPEELPSRAELSSDQCIIDGQHFFVGQRPYIELETTDHPLALYQHQGITMARVKELVQCLIHNTS